MALYRDDAGTSAGNTGPVGTGDYFFDLWCIAVYDLRLDPDFFWDLTPREFWALWDRHRLAKQRDEYHPAGIRAALHNQNVTKKLLLKSARDFMIDKPPMQPEEPKDGSDLIERLDRLAERWEKK